jgi:membrane protein insertase Oxa1/YidC/SpoIIIJ
MVQETSGVQTRDVILPDGGTMDPTAWQAIIEANTALVDEVMIPVTPETLAVHMWLMLQHDLGIPLWLAMALTTWGLRTVGLPLFFAQVRNMATMSFIAPKIQELKNKIEEQKHRGDDVMVKVWEDKLGALYKAFDVVPWKNFSNSLAVIPLMVAQAISARYMLGHTPHLLEDVRFRFIAPVAYKGLIQNLIFRLLSSPFSRLVLSGYPTSTK